MGVHLTYILCLWCGIIKDKVGVDGAFVHMSLLSSSSSIASAADARAYIQSHPDQAIAIHDRLEQSLAELSLSRLEHQWPVETVVTTGPDTVHPVPVLAGREQPPTLGYVIAEHINAIIRQMTVENAFPQLRIQKDYIAGRNTVPASSLTLMPVQAGLNTVAFSISKQLSSGTAQGTVYNVDIHPNRTYHYVDVMDVTSPAVGQQQQPYVRQITAVLKKSPIYDINVWKKYVALHRLQALQKRYVALDPSQQFLQEVLLDAQANALLRVAQLPPSLDWKTADLMAMAKRIESSILNVEFTSLNNAAYVDAAITLVGSKMVEGNLSPLFPLMYGSFRALDQSFINDAALRQILGSDMDSMPVQVIMEEKLDGSFKHMVVDEGWFFARGERDTRALSARQPVQLRADRLMHAFAQIVFGLAGAQRFFNFVHNDLHWENVMYKDVDNDHVLYYANNNNYYAVPTNGKWLKLIDFGRSRIHIGGVELYSAETLQVDSMWNISSHNNDLLRIVSVFLLTMLPGTYTVVGDATQSQDIMSFFDHVVQCGTSAVGKPQTLFDQVGSCLMRNGNTQQSACWRDEFSVGPFTTRSHCFNAVPMQNIDYFATLRIDPSQIPKDAIIYPF